MVVAIPATRTMPSSTPVVMVPSPTSVPRTWPAIPATVPTPAPVVPAGVIPRTIPSPAPIPAVPWVIVAISPSPVGSPTPVGANDEINSGSAVEVILNEIRVVASNHNSGIVETLNATGVGKSVVIDVGCVILGIYIYTTVVFIHIATIYHSTNGSNLSL